MLQYVCDGCGNIKQQGEVWILGFAAERLGVRAARREITIAPAWDENRAVQWFAVHFCSEQCKDDYVARLFGERLPAEEVVEAVTTSPTEKSVTRVVSARTAAGTKIRTERSRKKTVRRRRAA
jgi:hypothetical protein